MTEFKGLMIPYDMLKDSSLPAARKIILAEIGFLAGLNKGAGCWAGNEHFAELTAIKQRQVSTHISRLKKEGRIRVENGKSQRRRMWANKTEATARADDGDDIARGATGQIVADESCSRHDPDCAVGGQSGAPSQADERRHLGNPCSNVAAECVATAQQSATEETLRIQSEETMNREVAAVTSRDGVFLVSQTKWNEWKAYCAATRIVMDERQGIGVMSYLTNVSGYDCEKLIDWAIAERRRNFWNDLEEYELWWRRNR